MNLELQIPEEAASVLVAEYDNLPRAAVEALALEGYRSGRLSEGQVRQVMGFPSRIQVHAFLKEHGVFLRYSLAELNRDRELSNNFEASFERNGSHES